MSNHYKSHKYHFSYHLFVIIVLVREVHNNDNLKFNMPVHLKGSAESRITQIFAQLHLTVYNRFVASPKMCASAGETERALLSYI